MKGLLIKELYTSRILGKQFLLMIAMIVVLSIFLNGNAPFISMMLMMYLTITSLTLMQGDDAANWNRYAIALPLSRFSIVGARYLFLMLCSLAAQIIMLVVGMVMNFFTPTPTPLLGLLATGGVMMLLYMLINAINLPIAYKFGGEKARYASILVFLIPYLPTILFMDDIMAFINTASQATIILLVSIIIAMIFLLFFVSFFLSVRFFSRNDY